MFKFRLRVLALSSFPEQRVCSYQLKRLYHHLQANERQLGRSWFVRDKATGMTRPGAPLVSSRTRFATLSMSN